MENSFKYFLTILFISSMAFAQGNKQFNFFEQVNLTVSNQSELSLVDALIAVNKDKILEADKDFNSDAFIVYDNDKEIPSQIYKNGDSYDLVFVSDFEPNQQKEFVVKFLKEGTLIKEYTNRTYAELAMKFNAVYKDGRFVSDSFKNFTKVTMPKIHTDHDALFKYEGPGWESEKVAYRFYFDWRNATDIFGKKTNELVMNDVGKYDITPDDEEYHKMHDWGMDIFKVGNTLGLGSMGMTNGDIIEMVSKTDQVTLEIKANGPVVSEIKTDYDGWQVGENKFNLSSRLSINAGSRVTNVKLNICKNAENITSGFAKHPNTYFVKSESKGNWQYIALYGKQTLADDNLGIVLFYKKSVLLEQGENELNYYVKLKPEEGLVNYKYAAAWEQEQDGIKNKEEFIKYINDELVKLNNPLNIEIL